MHTRRFPTRLRSKGATFVEYATLVALLAAVAIGALFFLGLSVDRSFDSTNDTLADAQNQAGNGNGNGPGGGNNGNGNGNGGNPTCFVESGGDSTNSFDAGDTTVCFEVANGADELTTETNSDITVEATGGDKTLTLLGNGQKALTLTDVDNLTLTTTGALDAISTNVANLTADITSNDSVSWAGNGFTSLAYTHTGTAVGSLSFGALAAYGASIQTGDGEQDISYAGLAPSTVQTGSGNDMVSLSGGDIAGGSHNVNMGEGTNTADLACIEQTPPDAYTTYSLSVRVEGQDTINSDRCTIDVRLEPADTGAPVKSVAVVLSTAARGGNNIQGHAPYSSFSVTGTSGAGTSVQAFTSPEYMQGPINIDLTGSFYGADAFHWPTVSNTRPTSTISADVGVNPWPEGAETAPTGAHPANIRLDMSAHAGLYDTGGGARVTLMNPGSFITAEIVGMDLPPTGYDAFKRNAVFALSYRATLPGSDVANAVPVLRGNDATLNITMVAVGACWNARLVDPTSTLPDITLPGACSGAGVNIIDTASAPADASSFSHNVDLSVYSRLVIDRPTAPDLVFNYNGGAGDPGLDLANITINHTLG
jgi:Flp pilus assembly pilin Flp